MEQSKNIDAMIEATPAEAIKGPAVKCPNCGHDYYANLGCVCGYASFQGIVGNADPLAKFKCRFCGDLHHSTELDKNGHCQVCINGMARTNGD